MSKTYWEMTKEEPNPNKTVILSELRRIAPDLTWRIVVGEANFDWGTKEFPWGRQLPALLVEGGNQKGRRTPKHGQQYDSAITYLDSIGTRCGTSSIAAIRI